VTGDGAGIMTDIPFEFFGYPKGSIAVATLFMPKEPQRLRQSLKIFEDTFAFMGMKVLDYRDVPMDTSVLGQEALESLPHIQHVIIDRPAHCRTDESFNKALYAAKQATRTKHREHGFGGEFFFTSLSTTTIVYKALTKAEHLDRLYLDLQDPRFASRFALVHRRFSTNTRTSWDKAQPFRLIAHNGEINTIAGNRSWAFAREHALGLPFDELLTHTGISDSGSLNEMVEALKYRSSIPNVEDILAIMIPPADQQSSFYKFWSRAMEPWDQNPWKNPLGLASLAVMVIVFLSAAWHDWKSERDLRLPLMVAVCFLALVRVGGDERATMSKAMPIFGLAFVFLLAAVSARLRPRWLGLVAALLCAMPAVRSYDELRELIRDPYISVTDENIALELGDGQNWRLMGFLYYREDSHGFDWKAHPRFFSSMTCFLPAADQVRLAKKHGLPPP
jgi:glutamate synthase domain-containing protein 1